MQISELLERNKFKNINNLLEVSHGITFNRFLLKKITDSDLATICYLLIQFRINKERIYNLSIDYVYKWKENKTKIKSLEKLKAKLLKRHKLNSTLLELDIQKTNERLVKFMKSPIGYHTYGDYELFFSSYLAPFFSIESFSLMLNQSKEIIENIEGRKGLADYLFNEMRPYLKELEVEIENNSDNK